MGVAVTYKYPGMVPTNANLSEREALRLESTTPVVPLATATQYHDYRCLSIANPRLLFRRAAEEEQRSLRSVQTTA